MLRLLRNVRRAYKQWQALPDEERDQYSGEIQRIRDLVLELGGSRALRFVESDSDQEIYAEVEAAPTRARSVVIRELQEATSALLSKMAAPAARLASDSLPRSVRLSGRVVSAGVQRLGREHREK